ncbi:DUF6197 family protein [Streptomyces sp. AA1529]|uniref:DUF6197 family protein n=1 Tax=Streptomyces sp. AA1529 TaxID=1203257 RepID=UPI00031D03E0|nr:hypothetical protein [Streptomyces sp. AA1529]
MTAAALAPAAVSVGEPGLEARLAAVDAAMTVRLDEAALAHAVNTAHLPGPEVEIPHLPVATQPAAEQTPVAALLHRARARILRDGWCREAARTSGGMCLAEAIRAEARSHRDEGEARLLLRRALGGGDPIPEQNRRLANTAHAAAVLGAAADLATQRGL